MDDADLSVNVIFCEDIKHKSTALMQPICGGGIIS